MNRVYLFHGPAKDDIEVTPFLLSKRKPRQSKQLYYLAADELTITDKNGKKSIDSFLCPQGYAAVTLTRREADLITLANPGVRPPVALEDLHSWLPGLVYISDSAAGYRSLCYIVDKYGKHLTLASTYCDMKWNSICNALRRKTPLDKRFQVAWNAPIQEAFLLEEVRSDRSVITIDVNAMYSACMQHDIPSPAHIRKIELYRDYQLDEKLAVGLYRCQLTDCKTKFIEIYNPFTIFFCGRRIRPSLHETIEIDLNEFEIEYFSQHFTRIHILDAVISDRAVPHPLAREARRAFSRRKNYRLQCNKPLADREKYLATLLASCGSRPHKETKLHVSRIDAIKYLSNTYGISPPIDEPEDATNIWINRNTRFSMTMSSGGVQTISPAKKDSSTCYMLSQRIVAHGRIHILKLMERILSLNSMTEICYVNVDSIHFSIPSKKLNKIINTIRNEACEEMGSFKIESITKHGLWLEPGKYWLYSKAIEKHRNRSIGSAIQKPFQDHAFRIASREINKLHIPIRVAIRMEKSMSHVRALHKADNGVVRQFLIERSSSSSFSETLSLIMNIRKTDTITRLEAFKKLKHRISQGYSAASE